MAAAEDVSSIQVRFSGGTPEQAIEADVLAPFSAWPGRDNAACIASRAVLWKFVLHGVGNSFPSVHCVVNSAF
jgi:hypothetical protein